MEPVGEGEKEKAHEKISTNSRLHGRLVSVEASPLGKESVLLGGTNNLAYFSWHFPLFSKLIVLENILHFVACAHM